MEAAIPARPLNRRPLVRAALGFCLGIVCYEKCAGTWAVWLLCLFCAFALLLLFRRRYAPLSFVLAILYGMLRMRVSAFVDPSPLYAFLSPVAGALSALRDRLLTVTDLLFYDAAPILRGVLWGDTAHLAQADADAFRAIGVGHILALSGLHVSFFAGTLCLFIPAGRPKLRFVLTGVFLLFYSAIAAFPPSLVRASVMTLCFLGAAVFERRGDLPSSLALAALLILLFSPAALFEVGFQLSFGAVIGIALLMPPLSRLLSPLPKELADVAAVSVGATCGTLPLTALYFGRIPVYSLIANFLLLPLLPLSVVPAFVAVMLYPLSPALARLPAFVGYHIMALVRGVSGVLSGLPHAVFACKTRPGTLICVLCYILMLLCSDYVLRDRRFKRTGAAFLLILMLFCGVYAMMNA
ncbi:MAG: ComEC/Rec2 family competence protein [Eubacteriales bacterium]|nr:ComEC/Rec2 family competence protein [Eubacteriales bacterium]